MCEVMISLICACLPDLRIFILRMIWIAKGRPDPGTNRSNTEYKYGTKNSHIMVTNELRQTDYQNIEVGKPPYGKEASDADSEMELVDVLRATKSPIKSYVRRSTSG